MRPPAGGFDEPTRVDAARMMMEKYVRLRFGIGDGVRADVQLGWKYGGCCQSFGIWSEDLAKNGSRDTVRQVDLQPPPRAESIFGVSRGPKSAHPTLRGGQTSSCQ